MANTMRAELPIEIGGRTYVLKFTTGFVRRMEEAYPDAEGKPRQLAALFAGTPALSLVTRALWAALQPHEAKRYPTLDALEDDLDLSRMAEYWRLVDQGVRRGFGMQETPPPPVADASPATVDVSAGSDGLTTS